MNACSAFRIPLLGMLGTLVLTGCQQAVDSRDGGVETAPPTVTSQDFGAYVVHFNALPTDELTPEVAGTYGIVRSKNRAMLNVSILKKNETGLATPVAGTVTASATNLSGQFKRANIREIREGEAIYYIAELPVAHTETLTFNIEALAENEPEPFSIRFQKQFYSD